MKPTYFLNRSRDEAHNWNSWSRQWNNAWKGLSLSKEFIEQETLVKHKVEAARAKFKAFKEVLPRSE
jgi:hypothetical protein